MRCEHSLATGPDVGWACCNSIRTGRRGRFPTGRSSSPGASAHDLGWVVWIVRRLSRRHLNLSATRVEELREQPHLDEATSSRAWRRPRATAVESRYRIRARTGGGIKNGAGVTGCRVAAHRNRAATQNWLRWKPAFAPCRAARRTPVRPLAPEKIREQKAITPSPTQCWPHPAACDRVLRTNGRPFVDGVAGGCSSCLSAWWSSILILRRQIVERKRAEPAAENAIARRASSCQHDPRIRTPLNGVLA